MKLNFKKLKIENFLSFGNAELELSDNGYVFVKGVNENDSDNALSNGSGKSSLWEAISWCLCGETIRGASKDIANLNTDGGALVELHFDVDNNSYKVIRTKDHKEFKTALKIFINNEDKSGKGIRDTEKLLGEYLPDLTSNLLGSVVILGQGLPQRFSNNTPSGRKEVLEKLSKSDFMIYDLKDKITKRKLELSNELRTVEDELLTNNVTLSMLNDNLCKDEKLLETLKNSNNYDEQIQTLQAEIDGLNQQLNQYQTELASCDIECVKVTANLMQLNTDSQREKDNTEEVYKPQIDRLTNDWMDANNGYSIAKNELERLEKITDICPTCKQKLPKVIKPDTTEATQLVDALFTKQQSLKAELTKIKQEYQEHIDDINKWFKEKSAELQSTLTTKQNTKQRLEKLISDIQQSIVTKNTKLVTLITDKNNIQKNYIECQTRINDNLKSINELTEKILYNTNVKDNIQNRINIVNKFSSIVARDFRGYLLTNIIEYINKKAKEYSNDIFLTDKIEFVLDGNNISISYDGKMYENLSGGEKQKVDLIVQFAIRDMLSKFLNFSSNILVVDEIFDNLDRIGCQQVINLISTKLNDISSIFIVSHHTDIDIPYDKEIIVIKDNNGISRIK